MVKVELGGDVGVEMPGRCRVAWGCTVVVELGVMGFVGCFDGN